MRGMSKWLLLPAFVVLFALSVSSPASAQATLGTITGIVSDQTDALIPGAEVTVTNLSTNLVVQVRTNASGGYRIGELAAGRYRVEVTKDGFKKGTSTVTVNAGVIHRLDFNLEVGAVTEVMTVESQPTQVSTDDSRLAITVGSGQVANLPLNGRNVYALIQLAPGAVDARGASFEAGQGTVVNGLRPNFNGFLFNGSSNKGLSGGTVTLPNPDIIEEFQMLTLNMSAQYGNSAGSLTNVITKSGGNEFHGSAFYFLRRDALDANDFFRNAAGVGTTPVEFDQFGGTVTGPIWKDHLFFTASYQGQRFTTESDATPIVIENDAWRQAVIAARPNSIAAVIYGNFAPSVPGTLSQTLDQFVTSGASGSGFTSFADYLCVANYPAGFTNLATQFQSLFGVLATDNFAGCASGAPALQAGAISRNVPFLNDSVASFGSQAQGNLTNGNEWSSRVDWVTRGGGDRIYGEYYWQKTNDSFGPSNASSGPHGFANPQDIFTPNFSATWVHTISPTMVNEARAGYTRASNQIEVAVPGVPSIGFDDGSSGFGSYNGYPQFFIENIFSYSEMLSISKGKHNLKMGGDFRRNYENSTFNVGRPSYLFFDQLFFALDAPYGEIAGTDPGFISGGGARLDENNRAWRNFEMGLYFQDDWKVRRDLTLNLGMRYDLYTRHTEKFNRVTTWIPGPGGITPGQNGAYFIESITNANTPCTAPDRVLAGVCGPGGFAVVPALGGSDHNNFGPRVGVAWDVWGKGKYVLRGGYGASYEGTLYNPLSNSRWNPPFYSFNLAFNALVGDVQQVVYGPTTLDAMGNPVPTGAPVTFTGQQNNLGAGLSGTLNEGNIQGWFPNNPNTAFLTGVVLPEGIRDPFVHNYYVGIQYEFLSQTVLEVNWVGTRGYKLFRAEQINRAPGIRVPQTRTAGPDGMLNTADDVFVPTVFQAQGRTLTGLGQRFLNPNYGVLRTWLNTSRSWYDGLQVTVRRAMRNGFMFNANYAWSHSLDTGSGWHSGAVTANGGAAGDGYSLDPTRPDLDKGNSTFDVRHRFTFNHVWEFPWHKDQQGFAGKVLGGWQWNGIVSIQSGAHWTPYGSRNGDDFNQDGQNNDRPDDPNGNTIQGNKCMYANGYFDPSCGSPFDSAFDGANPFFGRPCVGCNGNLGRNTFEGPGMINFDWSFFKNTKISESMQFQFRFEMFNVFNRANFLLPSSATGANFANRIGSGIFGKSAGTKGPRNIQLGFRFIF